MFLFTQLFGTMGIGLVYICTQIKKEDIEYETGKIHVLEDNVKRELYPLFFTLLPNIGSKSKDTPYENVSLQGIEPSITFHCDLHKGI